MRSGTVCTQTIENPVMLMALLILSLRPSQPEELTMHISVSHMALTTEHTLGASSITRAAICVLSYEAQHHLGIAMFDQLQAKVDSFVFFWVEDRGKQVAKLVHTLQHHSNFPDHTRPLSARNVLCTTCSQLKKASSLPGISRRPAGSGFACSRSVGCTVLHTRLCWDAASRIPTQRWASRNHRKDDICSACMPGTQRRAC